MIFVSYYTRDSIYESYANKLEWSYRKFGLPYDILAIDDLGSWDANTQYKPEFCGSMLIKHKQPIVYVDADAEIMQAPAFFDNINCDIGFVKKDRVELLSGTLYLNNTPNVFKLIGEWIAGISQEPNIWEQKVLQKVVEKSDGKVELLPPTYCQIFDLMKDVGEPVIVQKQASRQVKIGG